MSLELKLASSEPLSVDQLTKKQLDTELQKGIDSIKEGFVGVKIVLKDGTILAIYVSKEKTMVNTNQYIQDRKVAEKIKEVMKNVCEI